MDIFFFHRSYIPTHQESLTLKIGNPDITEKVLVQFKMFITILLMFVKFEHTCNIWRKKALKK